MLCRRNVSRVFGAYSFAYSLRTQSMIGVMPMRGVDASFHALFGGRSSNASKHNAVRSFLCPRGISRSSRTRIASSIRASLFAMVRRDVNVDLLLRELTVLLRPFAEANQRTLVGEPHRPEIGRVHLCVPAECA